MRHLFAWLVATTLLRVGVLVPGAVEGRAIDVLRVRWQRMANTLRQVFIGPIRRASPPFRIETWACACLGVDRTSGSFTLTHKTLASHVPDGTPPCAVSGAIHCHISELFPKNWRGWPPDELTPATLVFAPGVRHEAGVRGDWRVSWSLRWCTDEACACQDMLAE